MKAQVNFDLDSYTQKKNNTWFVRCPNCTTPDYITAEKCHACFIDAMALNNKDHRGYNCKEGLFYRNQRADGNLI